MTSSMSTRATADAPRHNEIGGCSRARLLADASSGVVGAPEPEVVQDDVACGHVDHHRGADLQRARPADAREDVAQDRRVRFRTVSAPAQQRRVARRHLARLKHDRRQAHASGVVRDHAGRARRRRDQRGIPRPITTAPGRAILIESSSWKMPGARTTSSPARSASLISRAP